MLAVMPAMAQIIRCAATVSTARGKIGRRFGQRPVEDVSET